MIPQSGGRVEIKEVLSAVKEHRTIARYNVINRQQDSKTDVRREIRANIKQTTTVRLRNAAMRI